MTRPHFLNLKRTLHSLASPSLTRPEVCDRSILLDATGDLIQKVRSELSDELIGCALPMGRTIPEQAPGLRQSLDHRAAETLMAAQGLLPGLDRCRICPRRCGVNRNSGISGACGASSLVRLASQVIHTGEEPPISGIAEQGPVIHIDGQRGRGSGTLFFSGCALKCCFCQNYPISHFGKGEIISILDLALAMLNLQRKGAYNINLVTGSHYLPQFLLALSVARAAGLTIPTVLNSSGYDLPETLEAAAPGLDIHLPDCKYSRDSIASAYSGVEDYVDTNRRLLEWIAGHYGPLTLDQDGIATGGALVRHLVLPGHLENSLECLSFLEGLKPALPLSLMFQYFQPRPGQGPEGQVSLDEYMAVMDKYEESALTGFAQDMNE